MDAFKPIRYLAERYVVVKPLATRHVTVERSLAVRYLCNFFVYGYCLATLLNLSFFIRKVDDFFALQS
jgi:hypothetical protein